MPPATDSPGEMKANGASFDFRLTSSGLVAGRRAGGVWTGFGPFEKPSAPAFYVHAEVRALCSYYLGVYTGYAMRRVKLSGFRDRAPE